MTENNKSKHKMGYKMTSTIEKLVDVHEIITDDIPVYIINVAGINLRGYISKDEADRTASFWKRVVDSILSTGKGVEIQKLQSDILPIYMLKIGGIDLRPYLSYLEALRTYQYMTKIVRAITGTSSNLVLWNKLGSQSEIQNSQVGLGGTFSAGSFVPGKFGNAYSVNYKQNIGNKTVTFPKEVIPIDTGTIEFWAKITGFPSNIEWGARPYFLMITDNESSYGIGLNGNDGDGKGGICGVVGRGYTCGTEVYGFPTYEHILGIGKVEDWHHYALVWDKDGISGVLDNTKKVVIFLDEKLNSGQWYDAMGSNTYPVPLTSGQLDLVWKQVWPQGSIAMDNLKIWDYAKIDFSDRFNE